MIIRNINIAWNYILFLIAFLNVDVHGLVMNTAQTRYLLKFPIKCD